MVNQEIIVECKRVKFYCPDDKSAFFEWLKKIKSVREIKGKGDAILLILSNSIISDEDLDSLVSLFRRYKIAMKYLSVIVNDDNEDQFQQYQRGYSICVYPANQE
ncbi:MAG: hypothetical protein P4L31_04160 [Candidatus Babeliales bacterium]|nr:hypothetical protein [Candidatus Babeliales bacterium]